jgi:hypothetical protein
MDTLLWLAFDWLLGIENLSPTAIERARLATTGMSLFTMVHIGIYTIGRQARQREPRQSPGPGRRGRNGGKSKRKRRRA